MKGTILLSLLVCFSAFGQKKMTSFVNPRVKSEALLPLGKINDYFYTVTPGSGISRIHADTRELIPFLLFPEAENQSFDGIVTGNQLYFYNTRPDSSRVTIYKVNEADASYRESLTLSDVRAIAKNGNILYVTGSTGLKRINLEQEPAIMDTLLPENKIEGDVRPYSFFELKDTTGKHVSRAFLDAGQHLYTVTAAVNGSVTGEDFGDFVLFSFRSYSVRYYYFNKKSGELKPLFVSGEGFYEGGVLSNVVKMDDRYFMVRNHYRND